MIQILARESIIEIFNDLLLELSAIVYSILERDCFHKLLLISSDLDGKQWKIAYFF